MAPFRCSGQQQISCGVALQSLNATVPSRVVTRWAGIMLLLSPIAVQVGFATGLPPYVLGLPMVVGMAALASAVARG